ncbi:uncharacterized protein LOC121860571 isoform X2 [Homarus americanus]|uniref:uncharacterized protein LOC121860571 isoform X2 n=1 Tax=Homarus americanus TaxID=6706 RepID=UPI001C4672CF|nr:uncharacterized protein LOC121860571 isoform X2 [Homarus americanus]
MTLKTWLSGSHGTSHKHNKSTVDILSSHDVPHPPKLGLSKGLTTLPNGDVTLRRGLKNPFSTLTRTGGREWRVRSVEDVVEAEGGDYGFLEYYSLRRTSSRDTTLTDPRPTLTYGTWSRLNGTWGRWVDPSPAQFYPGTLTREDKTDRKRGGGDHRSCTYHLEDPWSPEDMRTSTPLSSTTSSIQDLPAPSITHSQQPQQTGSAAGETTRRGIVKRNSLLWRLRPDRWRGTDCSLRRARSRDDGLDVNRGRRKGDLGASQPDLLTSHRAPGNPVQCDVVSSPAPLSILPPTTRRAAHSETLPRRSRHSSKENNTNTLLARGRRWLHGASLGRADRVMEREESELMVQPETMMTHRVASTNSINTACRNNHKKALSSSTVSGPHMFGSLGREAGESDLWRRGRARSRRPRTFYLLEDYLSPVRSAGVAPAGVVLDEYVGHGPRLVFRELSNEAPQRPLPPTPEWDTPSLSPPSSVMNGHHPTPLQHHGLHHHTGGPSVFVDAIIPSPEKSGGSSVYSPVFSPRDSGYPRFVTPELALPELSLPDRAPPPISGLPPPTHALYTHNYCSLDRDERRRTKESRKSPAHHHHHKDTALHKLGRTNTTTRPPLSSKLRQNGLITAQKLPVLTNKSNSSSRVNLPHDSSSRTGHNHTDSDTGGGSEALKTYGDLLTEYERREIEAYPDVYYVGVDARKIHGRRGPAQRRL